MAENVEEPSRNRGLLAIDAAATSEVIETELRRTVGQELHRRGAVVAVSGGVDSATCLVLAARALGPDRVLGLLLPERESPRDGTDRARRLCESIGVPYVIEDISSVLDALGCYRRRDEAIRTVFPEYGAGYRQKIVVTDSAASPERLNYFSLVVESPDGLRQTKRMPADVYSRVVAATNMKQRTRKLREYAEAEVRNYAVIGTPNRLEFELGFFVRGGDGLADVKPIAHLYKTQVYALAEYLGVPRDILEQVPSTDTYSLPQTQEEFYFALPYGQMDLLIYGLSNGLSEEAIGTALEMSRFQLKRCVRDVRAKRRRAEQLMRPAWVIGDMREVVGYGNVERNPASEVERRSEGDDG